MNRKGGLIGALVLGGLVLWLLLSLQGNLIGFAKVNTNPIVIGAITVVVFLIGLYFIPW